MKSRNLKLDPLTQTFYNEKGEQGIADGLFYIERDLYKVTLLARAEVTVGRKNIRTERRLASATFAGSDAAELADELRAAGLEPPENLAALCETRPWQVRKRAKKGTTILSERRDASTEDRA